MSCVYCGEGATCGCTKALDKIEAVTAELNDPPHEIPHGDLVRAMQTLAADNARMCSIIIAADKLAEVFGRYMSGHAHILHVENALHDFKIARQGS